MKYNEKTTKAIYESIAHYKKNLHVLEALEGLVGTPLSPYTKLKARIDAITCDTSLREVDDVMQEIQEATIAFPYLAIALPIRNHFNSYIRIIERNDSKEGCKNILAEFPYYDKPEKIFALKQALTWLLNKSNLKDTCPECKGSKVCPHCKEGE